MIHVMPTAEKDDHSFDMVCECDPDVRWVNEDTGLPLKKGPIVIHNLLEPKPTEWAVYA